MEMPRKRVTFERVNREGCSKVIALEDQEREESATEGPREL